MKIENDLAVTGRQWTLGAGLADRSTQGCTKRHGPAGLRGAVAIQDRSESFAQNRTADPCIV